MHKFKDKNTGLEYIEAPNKVGPHKNTQWPRDKDLYISNGILPIIPDPQRPIPATHEIVSRSLVLYEDVGYLESLQLRTIEEGNAIRRQAELEHLADTHGSTIGQLATILSGLGIDMGEGYEFVTESLYNLSKSNPVTIPDGVLALQLYNYLKSQNISDTDMYETALFLGILTPPDL